MKVVLVFLLLIGSLSYASKQDKNEKGAFDLLPFRSSSGHWYGIKDKENIINPLPDQKRYDDIQITEIADNMLLYQRENGGWPKNYDMQAILTEEQKHRLLETKDELHTTFDNGTSYTQVDYLAKVYTATEIKKYKEACIDGFQFILDAQYDNGGWPQYYPLQDNYSRHITFNDGAYLGIMNLLKKVVNDNSDFEFIEGAMRKQIETAYKKGLECILDCQIVDQGRLTAWCQQHDEVTLEPAWARAFEPPSICNGESVSIVLLLMDIENPDQEVINAIQGAVKWFADSKIYNTRVETFDAPAMESKYKTITKDRRVVHDPTAPPIWTRYYELETERPLFCDRNSEFLYSMAEVSRERRVGYAWYIDAPQRALNKYPKWLERVRNAENVLEE
ncbi:pectate lyase [uncultured Sunxiuqinia sp.]|uniref:pectate lyase n=1 Tax=uncultured Sunxiuqinia sp. TaxID=1573825 RepID=UPI002AA7D165|nr:pectate lyase [uncultured Sunxiuqinia sp.]